MPRGRGIAPLDRQRRFWRKAQNLAERCRIHAVAAPASLEELVSTNQVDDEARTICFRPRLNITQCEVNRRIVVNFNGRGAPTLPSGLLRHQP